MEKIESLIFNTNNSDIVHYLFSFRLLIKHPTILLTQIKERVSLPMRNGWNVGDERIAPNGKPIGGFRSETYWNYRINVKGRRDFFAFSIRYMEDLITRNNLKNFFHEIHSTGGSIVIIINLSENQNIGDNLELEQMEFLLNHKIRLGVEYFP
jgi:hypothetical protein